MFSSSFTMSEQKHGQWTPYKQAAPDTVESVKHYWSLHWQAQRLEIGAK
jgi:hypothetical protein